MIGLCLAATLTLAAHGAIAQTTDVFGRTSTGAPSAVNTTDASQPQPATMPSIVREAVTASIHLQSRLNEKLQETLADQRDGSGLFATWIIVLCSFAYGVLHALGPGHGKLVVSAYLASRRARFIDAALLSGWSALVQSLSAIVLVGGAAWLSREGLPDILTRASSLELASYVALLCVGVWSLWAIATRRDCCDTDRVALAPKKRTSLLGSASASGDQDEAAYLGAYLGATVAQRRSRVRWARTDVERGTSRTRSRIFLTGIAVGVRPCAGAIFVLIAALANHVFIVGVLASLAMGAGVACTVLAIGMTSLSANRMVSNVTVFRRQKVDRIRFGLALAGAIFITAFAAWQVFALVSGTQAASLA
jgi:ABC-type nickel/cobalt efflux system permease component RcnA